MIEEFIGCFICGIKKDLCVFKNCQSEAMRFDLELMPHIKTDHVWGLMKKATDWYGKGIVEDVTPP